MAKLCDIIYWHNDYSVGCISSLDDDADVGLLNFLDDHHPDTAKALRILIKSPLVESFSVSFGNDELGYSVTSIDEKDELSIFDALN